MGAIPQVTLEDNEQFLQSIGYLAVINANGPFSGRTATRGFTNFKIREKAVDVKVGDDAFTGSEWGKVTAIAATKITVKFTHTIKPAGVANEDYNPIRTEVYPISLDAPVAGATEDNSWQTLSGIGVVFVYKVNEDKLPIVLESALPVIHANATPVSLDFNVAGVSVQKKVNGVKSGAAVVANGSGVASMPNGNTVGQKISYVASLAGRDSILVGPITVIP